MPLSVGVDFGTTKCAVARVNRRTGRPEILDLEGSDDGIVPTVILYEDGSADPLVGVRAERSNLAKAIESVKPLLGCDLATTEGENAEKARRLFTERGIAVHQIATDIFRFLLRATSEELGEPPTSAIITVPAYATPAARRATREAAEQAGWPVSYLIAEPVSAGIAYFRTTNDIDASRPHRMVVYDIGGGTFDFAALYYEPNKSEGPMEFRVYAKYGDSSLGGNRLDELIFLNAMKPHLEDLLKEAKARSESDYLDYWKLALRAAREAKHLLSEAEEAPLRFATGRHEKIWTLPPVKRSQFHQWIEPQVAATMERVDMELARIGWRSEDITAVILVGGGNRVPYIRDRIERRFGKGKVFAASRLDLMVALGSAVVADQQWAPNVIEVLARTLSVRVPGKANECRPLLKRGLALEDAKRTLTCYWQSDNASSISLDFCLGESSRWGDNEFLGRAALTSSEPLKRGTPIQLSIRMLGDGDSIEATARLQESGRPLDVTLERQTGDASLSTGSVALDHRPSVDIALLIDTSGSMHHRRRPLLPEIAAVGEEMASTIAEAGIDAWYAVVSYGDSTNGSCAQCLPFAPGGDVLGKRLRGLPLFLGGPEKEPSFRALRESLPALSTARVESSKWLLLITDAPARDWDEEIAQWLQTNGFRSVIIAPQQSAYDLSFDKLAVTTDGKYFDLSSELQRAFSWVAEKITGRQSP